MIDIAKPLEIVHVDGRVKSATFNSVDGAGDIYTEERVVEKDIEFNGIWNPDGTSWMNCTPSWKLRNRKQD